MKGEFLIQVNVASGANSGLERSQGTFTRIVTFFSHKPKNAFSIVSKAAEILHCYFITTSRLKAKYWLVSRSSTGQKSKIQVMTSRFECAVMSGFSLDEFSVCVGGPLIWPRMASHFCHSSIYLLHADKKFLCISEFIFGIIWIQENFNFSLRTSQIRSINHLLCAFAILSM